MNCLYVPLETLPDGRTRYQCRLCGHTRVSGYTPDKIHRRCPASSPESEETATPGSSPFDEATFPSLAERVWHFAAALKTHAAAGFPTLDQAGIDARLAICEQNECDQFTGTSCRKCGCTCNARKIFFNKLAWADQSCPLGLW